MTASAPAGYPRWGLFLVAGRSPLPKSPLLIIAAMIAIEMTAQKKEIPIGNSPADGGQYRVPACVVDPHGNMHRPASPTYTFGNKQQRRIAPAAAIGSRRVRRCHHARGSDRSDRIFGSTLWLRSHNEATLRWASNCERPCSLDIA